METLCQRCQEPVREADRFCAACGLPQLIYLAYETPAIPLESGTPAAEVTVSASGIAWRPALQAAFLLAIPAGLLSSTLSPILALFWIMGAAAWAVSLYARRVKQGSLTSGSGARIGLVTGLFAAWLSFGLNGIALWITRFWRHQGGQIDSQWVSAVQQGFERNQQVVAQAGMSTAQAADFLRVTQQVQGLMLSPEGRAGFAMVGLLLLAGILLVFATLGGVLGARLLVTPRRSGA